MYSIGDLAQLGGVSPRMLRHYHELGLLVPAEVDRATGYRRYEASQLGELQQVLALKGLGLALADIRRVVDGGVEPTELLGMLLLRRTELEAELDQRAEQLRRIEAHIQRLEDQMSGRPAPEVKVTTKALPAAHLAVASGVSPAFGPDEIGPVIRSLYPTLLDALATAEVEILGPSIAYYEESVDGGVGVHAGFPIDDAISHVPGVEVVDLPAVDLAATAVHRGDMATVDVDTVMPMLDWIRTSGFRTTGYSREHYLDCPEDVTRWRTELQFPIEPDLGG